MDNPGGELQRNLAKIGIEVLLDMVCYTDLHVRTYNYSGVICMLNRYRERQRFIQDFSWRMIPICFSYLECMYVHLYMYSNLADLMCIVIRDLNNFSRILDSHGEESS